MGFSRLQTSYLPTAVKLSSRSLLVLRAEKFLMPTSVLFGVLVFFKLFEQRKMLDCWETLLPEISAFLDLNRGIRVLFIFFFSFLFFFPFPSYIFYGYDCLRPYSLGF